MTFMRDRTFFDAESGSIMDLPRELRTKRGEEVHLSAKASLASERNASSVYVEKWNRPGEFAAYRERVEAQFSAPVKREGDTRHAVSIVISGFPASGKSTIGRIIARALMQSGIRVKTQGQRATLGIADMGKDTAELDRIRLSPVTEPMSVEIWEVDQASPNNH